MDRLLSGLSAAGGTGSYRGIAAQHLSQGIVGFKHHMLRLLQQGCRLDRSHFGRFCGGGGPLGESKGEICLFTRSVEGSYECLLSGHGSILRSYRIARSRLTRYGMRFESDGMNGSNLPAGHISLFPTGVYRRSGEHSCIQVDG